MLDFAKTVIPMRKFFVGNYKLRRRRDTGCVWGRVPDRHVPQTRRRPQFQIFENIYHAHRLCQKNIYIYASGSRSVPAKRRRVRQLG